MNAVFVFGAGISLPAGMPSTDNITERIKSRPNIPQPEPDQHTSLAPPLPQAPYQVHLLIDEIFHLLKHFYKKGSRHVNYENCCFIATQLDDIESGEFDNAAVQPLVDKLMKVPKLKAALNTEADR